jgi:hypothetical protein
MPAHPAVMEMPEAAVDENDLASAREDQVRIAGKPGATGPAVESVAIPLGMEEPAHQQLRLGVLASDPGHVPTALLRAQLVRHATSLGS